MSENRPGNEAGRPPTQWLGKPKAPAITVGDTSTAVGADNSLGSKDAEMCAGDAKVPGPAAKEEDDEDEILHAS
eukprot:3262760-Pyramimonas_sp.AAC.1